MGGSRRNQTSAQRLTGRRLAPKLRVTANFIVQIISNKKMPKQKQKTVSGAKKRFAITGSGKIKRKHAYKSHILTKKTKKRKRNLTYSGLVHDTNEKQVKEMLLMK